MSGEGQIDGAARFETLRLNLIPKRGKGSGRH